MGEIRRLTATERRRCEVAKARKLSDVELAGEMEGIADNHAFICAASIIREAAIRVVEIDADADIKRHMRTIGDRDRVIAIRDAEIGRLNSVLKSIGSGEQASGDCDCPAVARSNIREEEPMTNPSDACHRCSGEVRYALRCGTVRDGRLTQRPANCWGGKTPMSKYAYCVNCDGPPPPPGTLLTREQYDADDGIGREKEFWRGSDS